MKILPLKVFERKYKIPHRRFGMGCTDTRAEVIGIDMRRLKDTYGVFALLHEIGHVYYKHEQTTYKQLIKAELQASRWAMRALNAQNRQKIIKKVVISISCRFKGLKRKWLRNYLLHGCNKTVT